MPGLVLLSYGMINNNILLTAAELVVRLLTIYAAALQSVVPMNQSVNVVSNVLLVMYSCAIKFTYMYIEEDNVQTGWIHRSTAAALNQTNSALSIVI